MLNFHPTSQWIGLGPLYLATHANVDAADYRRCTLERYLCDRWHAGESDPEELTCSGLSFLWRLERDNW